MQGPMTALGLVFLFLVLVDTVTRPTGNLASYIAAATWVLWAVFALEFVARAVIAPDTRAFFRKNWWQVIFLVLPFLRFVRALSQFRVLRAGRIVSSATRSSRTAGIALSNRIIWLGAVTAIVTLASSQILFEFSSYEQYGQALHAAALATMSGEPLGKNDGYAQVLDVVLTLYSVVVFASAAGAIGAYFLEQSGRRQTEAANEN